MFNHEPPLEPGARDLKATHASGLAAFEDRNQPPHVLGEMAEFPGAEVLNKLATHTRSSWRT
jgi:hypothetical protein